MPEIRHVFRHTETLKLPAAQGLHAFRPQFLPTGSPEEPEFMTAGILMEENLSAQNLSVHKAVFKDEPLVPQAVTSLEPRREAIVNDEAIPRPLPVESSTEMKGESLVVAAAAVANAPVPHPAEGEARTGASARIPKLAVERVITSPIDTEKLPSTTEILSSPTAMSTTQTHITTQPIAGSGVNSTHVLASVGALSASRQANAEKVGNAVHPVETISQNVMKPPFVTTTSRYPPIDGKIDPGYGPVRTPHAAIDASASERGRANQGHQSAQISAPLADGVRREEERDKQPATLPQFQSGRETTALQANPRKFDAESEAHHRESPQDRMNEAVRDSHVGARSEPPLRQAATKAEASSEHSADVQGSTRQPFPAAQTTNQEAQLHRPMPAKAGESSSALAEKDGVRKPGDVVEGFFHLTAERRGSSPVVVAAQSPDASGTALEYPLAKGSLDTANTGPPAVVQTHVLHSIKHKMAPDQYKTLESARSSFVSVAGVTQDMISAGPPASGVAGAATVLTNEPRFDPVTMTGAFEAAQQKLDSQAQRKPVVALVDFEVKRIIPTALMKGMLPKQFGAARGLVLHHPLVQHSVDQEFVEKNV